MVQIEVNRAVAQNVRRLPLNCCDCWTIYKWWTVRQKIYNISNKEQICTVPATSCRPFAKSNGGKLLLSNLVLIIISENTDATNWSELFFLVTSNQAENMYELINLTHCVVQFWQVHFGVFSMFCFLGPPNGLQLTLTAKKVSLTAGFPQLTLVMKSQNWLWHW